MASQGTLCALGNHFIRGHGVRVTNPRLISFIRKVRPNYQSRQLMCQQCKAFVERVYKLKVQSKTRRELNSSISVSSLSTSSTSSTSSNNDGESTTTTTTSSERSINVERGIRLPHIQPAVRQRTVVSTNPDIVNIYLRQLTGG